MTTAVKEKFLVVGGPDISESEEQAVLEVLRSGWLGNGHIARKFEREFVASLGVDFPIHGLAVNSCTSGIYLALKAEGIGVGNEVITTPLTFAATVNAVLMTGASVVFVDVDPMGRIDPAEIKKAITHRTKAIIPVHLHGIPCDMDPIIKMADQNGLVVIEDAAHGYGGSYNGKPLGTIGHYGVFSFYPTKNITTGDGGMVLCRDIYRSEKMRTMASQGLSSGAWMRYGSGPVRDYCVEEVGMKGLLNDLNAAIGREQLKRWPEMKKRRSEIFNVYEEAFGRKPEGSSQHIYSIFSVHRSTLRKYLQNKGIGTGIHYNPLHKEPAYPWAHDFHLPMAEMIGSRTLSLPLSSKMTVDEAKTVVKAVKEYGEGK